MTPKDLDRKRRWARAMRAERRKHLRCVRCGERTNGLCHCERCRESLLAANRELKRARRAAGLCRCGREKPEGSGRCDQCRANEAEARRRWKAKWRELNRQRREFQETGGGKR